MPADTYPAPLPASKPAPPAPAPPAVRPQEASDAAAPKTDLGLTAAVTGIIADTQKLFYQQLALLRAELRSDWEKSKRAMAPAIFGVLCVAGASLLLAMTGALALHWSLAPAGTDPSQLPLWACFGIVGLVLALFGSGLVLLGVRTFQSFNPLPDETAAALERNLKAIAESGKANFSS